ncbi:hypothetical protein RRG08_044018 [Elysia crispata]|uniref:AGC-kinase C-terminal domain-containing protein n=1 Tax=Elysia crispata TaxID=231223 RepID=A0AAE1CR39_9GAST|nr:hypothetical protein RRG08_044018 [Elysia crispata]
MKGRKDVSNFDREFTSEAPKLTPTDKLFIMNLDQDEFSGFSYVNPEVRVLSLLVRGGNVPSKDLLSFGMETVNLERNILGCFRVILYTSVLKPSYPLHIGPQTKLSSTHRSSNQVILYTSVLKPSNPLHIGPQTKLSSTHRSSNQVILYTSVLKPSYPLHIGPQTKLSSTHRSSNQVILYTSVLKPSYPLHIVPQTIPQTKLSSTHRSSNQVILYTSVLKPSNPLHIGPQTKLSSTHRSSNQVILYTSVLKPIILYTSVLKPSNPLHIGPQTKHVILYTLDLKPSNPLHIGPQTNVLGQACLLSKQCIMWRPPCCSVYLWCVPGFVPLDSIYHYKKLGQSVSVITGSLDKPLSPLPPILCCFPRAVVDSALPEFPKGLFC